MALTGEDKTLGYFLRLQSIVNIHAHFPFYQFGPAGAANASLAGIGQVGTYLQSSV
jgi:hypothetical protein